ncbi:hypothetical protein K443DRAFT_682716 [Laccaria amethystina LaAM-08-1]|uniref:Uncharacterized protein n=1 Tax=Laccaria amethystina LaAM-08-1 TaxID=1095629 RepID=A0A0C9XDQ5_9AGAR|nr:hypothetical protein K443DRAFT_682716 [Laccaria amethystina LaAM-08-1]
MAGIFCECSILIRLGQDLHLVAGGSTSSYSHCLKCQDAIQKRNFSEEMLILFGRTGYSLKIVKPYFKRNPPCSPL